jgi:hypothetical protein
MQVIEYSQLGSSQRQLFFEFLQESSKETAQPAHSNMWDENWHSKSNTLPYLLNHTDRFGENGQFLVVFDGNDVVACSGVYRSDFCPELALAGTRAWIAKNYRNHNIARNILLPVQKSWSIERGYKAIAICFNEYNKNIINIWKRVRLGEKRTPRQPHHLCYNGVNDVDFPVTIQYTKQWLIYEKIDDDFEFDWSVIKWKD